MKSLHETQFCECGKRWPIDLLVMDEDGNENCPECLEIFKELAEEERKKEKENKQRITDIINKVQWKTATFAERNILNIYNNRKLKA